MLTDEQLDELDRLEREADRDVPWIPHVGRHMNHWVVDSQRLFCLADLTGQETSANTTCEADARLISASRNALRDLIDEVRAWRRLRYYDLDDEDPRIHPGWAALAWTDHGDRVFATGITRHEAVSHLMEAMRK